MAINWVSEQTRVGYRFKVEVFWMKGGKRDGNDVWRCGKKAFNSTEKSGATQRVGDWAVYFFEDGNIGWLC